MRNLKALSLALVVVFAIGVTAAQASVDQPTLTAEGGATSVILTADQSTKNELTVPTGTVKCNTLTIDEITQATPTTTVEVHPNYSGCTFVGIGVTIDTTACNYLFHFTTNGAGAATTDVVCTGENTIKVTEAAGLKCTVSIGSQTGLEGATFDNAEVPGGKRDLTMTVSINTEKKEGSIKYTETGAGCASPGTRTNARYLGTNTVTGFTDVSGKEGVATGIFFD